MGLSSPHARPAERLPGHRLMKENILLVKPPNKTESGFNPGLDYKGQEMRATTLEQILPNLTDVLEAAVESPYLSLGQINLGHKTSGDMAGALATDEFQLVNRGEPSIGG